MGLAFPPQREQSFDLLGGVSKLYFIPPPPSALMKLDPGSGNLSLPVSFEHYGGNLIQSGGSSRSWEWKEG